MCNSDAEARYENIKLKICLINIQKSKSATYLGVTMTRESVSNETNKRSKEKTKKRVGPIVTA